MCTQYYTTKIYSCGDHVEEDVNFESCGDISREGHEVKRTPLGSRREGEKCGRYDCRNP
ncbi:hypothetical protein F5Y03DRAFT_349359 [Xylaria venustula]|nr:hypothetical protein F5Y03DRAFT_349359 [Xylaria venustula]